MIVEKTKNESMSIMALKARPVYTLTIGEFIDVVKSELNNEPQQITEQKEKILIRGIHGLAKFLGTSPVTAQALKNSGKIPYSQFGRVILFDGDKVLEAMAGNKKNRRA
jgi:hypothetical protein